MSNPEAFRRRQEEILADLDGDLKEVYQRGAKRHCQSALADVLLHYDTGKDLLEVTTNSSLGDEAVRQLAVLWNLRGTYDEKKESNYLYDLRDFATRFERDWVRDVLNRGERQAFPIRLKHFLVLKRIDDDEAVATLVRRMITERLSAARLYQEVKGQGLASKSSKGGRKPLLPASPYAAARQAAEECKRVANRMAGWDQRLFAVCDADGELHDMEITDQLLETIRQAGERMSEVGSALIERARKCERVVKTLKSHRDRLESGSRPPKRSRIVAADVEVVV